MLTWGDVYFVWWMYGEQRREILLWWSLTNILFVFVFSGNDHSHKFCLVGNLIKYKEIWLSERARHKVTFLHTCFFVWDNPGDPGLPLVAFFISVTKQQYSHRDDLRNQLIFGSSKTSQSHWIEGSRANSCDCTSCSRASCSNEMWCWPSICNICSWFDSSNTVWFSAWRDITQHLLFGATTTKTQAPLE